MPGGVAHAVDTQNDNCQKTEQEAVPHDVRTLAARTARGGVVGSKDAGWETSPLPFIRLSFPDARRLPKPASSLQRASQSSCSNGYQRPVYHGNLYTAHALPYTGTMLDGTKIEGRSKMTSTQSAMDSQQDKEETQ